METIDITPLVNPEVILQEPQPSQEEVELAEALHAERAEQERLSNKPYIDHLEDAVEDDILGKTFNVPVGKNVIIERYTTSGGRRVWLDTKVYEVVQIDQDSGFLRLYDNEWQHNAMSNFKTGIEEYGYRFKIAGKDLRLRKEKKMKVKLDNDQKKKEKKEAKKKKQSLRRIYRTRGVIHTRIRGQAYGPTNETQAGDGDRLEVSSPKDGVVTITHPENGWNEAWGEIDL